MGSGLKKKIKKIVLWRAIFKDEYRYITDGVWRSEKSWTTSPYPIVGWESREIEVEDDNT